MLNFIIKHSIRRSLARFGAAALIGCSSENGGTEPEPEPAAIALEILPTSLNILQGESASVTATVTRTGDFTGTVDLTVTAAPTGVTGAISNVQTSGRVTTATVTIEVDGTTTPGSYGLVLRGTGAGVSAATAQFGLVVTQVLLLCPLAGLCEQWAAGATASSEYTSTDWSGAQATGPPNVIGCSDDAKAWGSAEANGVDWLELTYNESVFPSEIRVHEVFGVSSIVSVEVKDGAGTYHTVYAAQPGRQNCPRILSIPVTGIPSMIKAIRLNVDQRSLNDWNEIDAVKLIGNR